MCFRHQIENGKKKAEHVTWTKLVLFQFWETQEINVYGFGETGLLPQIDLMHFP